MRCIRKSEKMKEEMLMKEGEIRRKRKWKKEKDKKKRTRKEKGGKKIQEEMKGAANNKRLYLCRRLEYIICGGHIRHHIIKK
jgi:hypothetical protein